MVTIDAALRRVKDELPRLLAAHAVNRRARGLGHRFRMTLLDPAMTLHLWVMQILARHLSAAALRHPAGKSFTASAYCQARQRLPLDLIKQLAQEAGRGLSDEPAGADAERFGGHRVWVADASSAGLADTPDLQARFGQSGQQKKGCGFPTAAIMPLLHAASGAITDLLIRPLRSADMSGVAHLHEGLDPGDLLLGDRAHCSFAHLALLAQKGLHGCFRMHQKVIVSFRYRRRHAGQFPKARRAGRPTSEWLKRLGKHDQVVRWFKPKGRPDWMSRAEYDALPDALEVRELRYRVGRKGFRTREVTLATTLTDPRKYPAQELAELYFKRWRVERALDDLKTSLGMAVLRCKTAAGVEKELWAFVLVYNLVRQVMLEAAHRQGVDPWRISFADALAWLTHARAGQELGELIVNPLREGRFEPRVIKRRRDKYSVMTRPRDALRKELERKGVAA